MKNMKIRLEQVKANLLGYEIASLLEISVSTWTRMMRAELPKAEQDRICKVIREYREKHHDK